MAALYSPALAATESRAARISARTCSSAPFSAFHSASGSPDEPVGISGSTGWKWRAGPETIPGAPGRPVTAFPASCAGSADRTGMGGAGRAASSSKSRPARSASASSAAAAWGPCAETRISCPWRMPRVASPLRLRPLAGPRPLVRFMTWTFASKPAAVWTKRAAGRACRPSGLRTSSRSVSPSSSGGAVPAGPSASGPPAPSCAVFPCSPPRASFATSASGSPSRAATAAATAPSTSGASHRSTDSRCSGVRKSSAVSALRTALPRSISTSTPPPESARSIASMTRTASVPSAPSSARPPASSSFTSGPAISAASSRTPSASVPLCETITIPTTTI